MRKGRLPVVVAAVLVMTVALAPAVWAAPGTQISNVLEAVLTEEGKAQPTITIHEDLSDRSIVGLWDVFSVSTTPGDYEGQPVRVMIQVTGGPADGFDLEYVDPDDGGTFKPLGFSGSTAWFGPAEGFPLKQATSIFRVTWKEAGTYTAEISIKAGPDFTQTLAYDTVTVQVLEDGSTAIRLQWAGGATSIDLTYAVHETFPLSAQAHLDNDLTHVDGVLYVILVTKDGSPAATGDLTVRAAGGQALGYDAAGGYFYWGPRDGFTLGCVDGITVGNCAADGTSTTFDVTIHQAGTYSVKAYAVQLDPEDAFKPRSGD